MHKKHKESAKTILIRRTNVLMVLRIFLIQLMSIFGLLVVGSAVLVVFESFGLGSLFGIIILGVTVFFMNIAFSVAVYMEWRNKTYEIRPEGVVYKRGVLFKREMTYPFNNIETITLKQGILGQYFGYGSLRIYDPALQQTVEITNIIDPGYYKKILTKRYIVDDNESSSRVIFS